MMMIVLIFAVDEDDDDGDDFGTVEVIENWNCRSLFYLIYSASRQEKICLDNK
jgi:hypothetical protein